MQTCFFQCVGVVWESCDGLFEFRASVHYFPTLEIDRLGLVPRQVSIGLRLDWATAVFPPIFSKDSEKDLGGATGVEVYVRQKLFAKMAFSR